MIKEQPIFKQATFWLNKICILPYTEEELNAIGCLGFDMARNKDFADKYMSCLLEKRELINQHKRVPFSELNLQLYRNVLNKPDLEQVPDWIKMPDEKDLSNHKLKARIVKMSQNIKNNNNILSASDTSNKTR